MWTENVYIYHGNWIWTQAVKLSDNRELTLLVEHEECILPFTCWSFFNVVLLALIINHLCAGIQKALKLCIAAAQSLFITAGIFFLINLLQACSQSGCLRTGMAWHSKIHFTGTRFPSESWSVAKFSPTASVFCPLRSLQAVTLSAPQTVSKPFQFYWICILFLFQCFD